MRPKRLAISLAVVGAIAMLVFAVAGGCAWSGGGSSATTGEATTSSAISPSTTTTQLTTSSTSTTVRPTTTTASPTTSLPSAPAKDYIRLPTHEKVVALTFDAAYDPAPLKGILAALKVANADATFFLTGEFIRDFPQWTKAIIAAGYPIGNHSYSHPDFTTLSDNAMRLQMEKMATALTKLGGKDPKPLFRAPYGALNKRVLSVLRSEGYVSVFWTIDTLDWEPNRTSAQIQAVVLSKLAPGAIILMHVGGKQTAQALPELLAKIKVEGYGFVNLRDALPGAR